MSGKDAEASAEILEAEKTHMEEAKKEMAEANHICYCDLDFTNWRAVSLNKKQHPWHMIGSDGLNDSFKMAKIINLIMKTCNEL